MGAIRVVAIIAVLAGALGLLYGGFSYTKENTVAKLGPIELKAEERKDINIPVWAGVAALVAGGAALLLTAKK